MAQDSSSESVEAQALLGTALRAAREERGIGLRDIARRLNRTHSALSDYETGKALAPDEVIRSYARELNMPDRPLLVLAEQARIQRYGDPERLRKPPSAPRPDVRSLSRTRRVIRYALPLGAAIVLAGSGGLVFNVASRRDSPPQNRQVTSLAALAVVGPLAIDPPNPQAGQWVQATFRVRNSGSAAITIPRLRAGGRVDSTGFACAGSIRASQAWTGPIFDFPSSPDVFLAPGLEYTYQAWRRFDEPRAYFAEPVAQHPDGHWGGIGQANRVCFAVAPSSQ